MPTFHEAQIAYDNLSPEDLEIRVEDDEEQEMSDEDYKDMQRSDAEMDRRYVGWVWP